MQEKIAAFKAVRRLVRTVRQGITMKRILFTSVALGVLGLMSPALGADLPAYTKAPAVASPMYDWTGFYVGVYGGGGYGNHNVVDANGLAGFANFTANYSSQGAIGGGEIGYNAQSGNYLIGVEASGFWSGIKGNDANQVAAGAFAIGSVDQSNLKRGGALLARGGITVDRLLLFFTGGWGFGDITHTNTDPVLGIDTFTNHRNGLAAGGGIAWAFTDNVIGKVEYRYYDFGAYTRQGMPVLTPNGQLPYTVNTTYNVVTLGVDFKWGGVTPVVARY
jgi:outer membrane immunogenic protein